MTPESPGKSQHFTSALTSLKLCIKAAWITGSRELEMEKGQFEHRVPFPGRTRAYSVC